MITYERYSWALVTDESKHPFPWPDTPN